VTRFVIPREWLSNCLTYADSASEVTFGGDEARALLQAAWKGMRYAPDSRSKVFDFVPADNPNWLRYRREGKPEGTKKAKPDLRVVADNVEDKES
jgi:hypothetical protein